MSDYQYYAERISKRFIAISFLIAILIDFVPLSGSLFQWLPEFTALVLIYWLINKPNLVGIGVAFVVGLLLDVGVAAPLGQHALSYIVCAYLVTHFHRQIVLFNYGLQSMVVFAILMCNQFILMLISLFYYHRFSGALGFLAPFIGALLWPMLNKVMVTILNFRRTRR